MHSCGTQAGIAVSLWSVQPANHRLSDREANEAYIAASKGHAGAVYFPAGGEVRVDLSDIDGPLIAHWINIDTGEFGRQQRLTGGANVKLSPPGKENWAAAIVAQ